ncbi:MAG: ribosome maturation factor RimP [Polyangiaceae bacterium]|nr:ribosome maturation factor RimP [Polyangiaceae bacterium]
MPFRPPTSNSAASTEPHEADRSLASVRAIAAPLCVAHGVDIVDIVWTTERAGRTMRVTIERKGRPSTEGWGVTLEDCAELSRDLSLALDHDDVVTGSYNLEVSSPGLERDLSTVEELVRFKGELARVKLSQPAPDGQRVLRGELLDVSGVDVDPSGAKLTMRVDKKEITVPVAHIVQANLVFEMPTTKKSTHASGVTKSPGARSSARHAGEATRAKQRGANKRSRGRQEGAKGSGS